MYHPRSPYSGREGRGSPGIPGRGRSPLARGKIMYQRPPVNHPPVVVHAVPGFEPQRFQAPPPEGRFHEMNLSSEDVGEQRQIHIRKMPLQYHYEEDQGDWVLMGHDLHPLRRSIQMRANFFFAVAMFIEVAILAWPATAISLWGITEAILTIAFFIVHVPKITLLIWAIFAETHVYKMYGRRTYSVFWGLWTRRSHVRSNTALSIYGFIYGWVQVPVMLTYILLALTAYPLGLPTVLWWVQWLMGIVSLVAGYVAWCFIVSEMAIRKNLEQYVAFSPEERISSTERKSVSPSPLYRGSSYT